VLANAFHLMVRPGIEIIRRAGGLHAFMGWARAILTDSGGFQVMSLASRRRITEDGVEFRSPEDGSKHFLTPERAMELQSDFGVDIAMALDVCPPFPAERSEIENACALSQKWAARSLRAYRGPGLLFGIVQGGTHEDLRRGAAQRLLELPFAGFAVGGVAVGESKDAIRSITALTAALLPADRPRYLMGVGTPADLLESVRAGIDLFDCVLPARNARHGVLFTREGVLKIHNARFRDDPRPVDAGCACPCCSRLSRAFLHHLMRAGELTGPVLATLHNLRYYLDFMAELRQAIALGALADLAARLAFSPLPPDDPQEQRSP